MAALSRREAGALETLYDQYSVLAFTLAYRMLGERQAAEDVVQEAFVNVWRSAERFDGSRSSPRSWLMSIVRNRCIDKIRGNAARPQTTSADAIAETPGSSDVWREVSQTLTSDDVKAALVQLPQEQRQTIELAYFGGLTQVEIAEKLQVPLGTVKSRVRIGLERLRDLLASSQRDLAT